MARPHLSFLLDGNHSSRRTLFGLVLLILLAYLGNYFHWTLFFSIDFLFGSIAVWLVVCLYGPVLGTIVGFIAATCTFILWNHPYAIATFTLEALFVGILFHRQRKSIVLLDAIFWLLIGAPWIWITYPLLLHIDPTQTQFILLKQSVNGLFNAIVASQLLTYLPIHRWVNRPAVVNQFPLQQTLFNLLVAFVFFPTLILILLASHRVVDDIRTDAKADLNAASRYLVAEVRAWYQQQVQTMSTLASLIETNQLDALQDKVNVNRLAVASFQAFYVVKPDGTIIQTIDHLGASAPPNPASLPFPTLNAAVLQQLLPALHPTQPQLWIQKQGQSPSIMLAMPLTGTAQRLLLGVVNPNEIDKRLNSNLDQQDLQITLVDQHKTVIASTEPDHLGKLFDRRQTGTIQSMDEDTYHWLPTKDAPIVMAQWTKSIFGQETLIDRDTNWTLITETLAEPRIHYVEKVYSQNLTLLLIVAGFALILAHWMSRYLVKPLTQLTAVTTNLPNKLLDREVITWSHSPITEIALLTRNFHSMATSLKQKFGEIQQANETLEQRVQERTQALLQANAELESEITEREQVEAALRQSEANNQALISAIPDLLLWIHQDGTYLEALGNIENMRLYKPLSEMIGIHIYDILPLDIAQERMHYIQRAMQTHELQVYEYQIEIEGELRDEEARIVVRGEQQVLCIVRDITDRKQAERELQQKEQFWRLLLDNIPEQIFWKDRQSTYLGGNRLWAEMAGLPDALTGIGRTDYDLPWEAGVAERYRQEDRSIIETGQPLQYVEHLLKVDGERIWVRVNKVPIWDMQGRVTGILGTVEDITRSKLTDESLHSRNQELLTLHKISEITLRSQSLNAAFQGIVEEISTATAFPSVAIELYDAARQVMVFEGNKGIPLPPDCDVLEVPVNHTLSGIVATTGQPMVKYFDPQGLKQCTANETLNSLDVKTFICMPMIVNQRTIGALSLACPEEMPIDDSFLRWVSSLANYLALITDRKQAETSLRESEERLKLALDATQMGIWDLNPLNDQATWSESCEILYGLTPGSFEGNHAAFLARVYPDDRQLIQQNVMQAIQTGVGLNHEFRITHPDGSIHWILERGHGFYNEAGKATRLLGIALDITDRKRTEESIRQLNEALEQRVAQRTDELESLINAMPDYIYVIDREEMRLSFCNDVFARGTPYQSRHEVRGKTLPECFSAEIAAYFAQQNNQVFASGQPLHQQEQLNLPIGLRHFETFKIPLKKPNGEIYALLGTSRDNTSLMEIQRTLSERTTQLEMVNHTLEQRNQEITLLSQMSDLLQACLNQAESQTVITQLLPRLFPDYSGAVFLISDSQNSVEAIAQFGHDTSHRLFAPHECFALRRGQPHFVEHTGDSLCCKHLINPLPPSYFCVPMVARGKAIGVLSLSTAGQEPFISAKQQLATAAAQQIALALANLKLYETLQTQSTRDPLTGLFNRRYLEESLAQELYRAQRSQYSLSIVVIDVDHFKRFNDTFGHDAGDAVLRELGSFLQSRVRGSDIACRLGGEEMVLILPGASLADACQRAEQLRQGVKQLTVQHHQPLGQITISLGVACFPAHAASATALIKAADAALYQAKAAGRDRVIIAN